MKIGNNVDLVGTVSGWLTVVAASPHRKNHRRLWVCQCVCGNQTTVTTEALRRSRATKSCGCIKGTRHISPPRKRPPLPSIDALRDVFVVSGKNLVYRKNILGICENHIVRHAGEIAGCVNDAGYRVIWYANQTLRAHRIVFALHHGRWPIGEIDHIDRDRQNNSPANLRECTRRQNNHNLSSNVGVGKPVGACFTKDGRWASQITIKGTSISLGAYSTAHEAAEAYRVAEELLPSIADKPTSVARQILAQKFGVRLKPRRGNKARLEEAQS